MGDCDHVEEHLSLRFHYYCIGNLGSSRHVLQLTFSSARMTRFFAAELTPFHRMTARIVSQGDRERESGASLRGWRVHRS